MGGHSLSTTTAYSYCTSASQFGLNDSWSTGGIIGTVSPTASIAPASSGREHKTLQIHTPTWASSILAGSEFVSMDVQIAMYNYATEVSYFNFVTRQNGVTTKTIPKTGTSSSTVTHSGDASYWGFTGTPQTIISQIKSGSIRFWFEGDVYSLIPYQERHITYFAVRVTYREPDTKRASLLQVIP